MSLQGGIPTLAWIGTGHRVSKDGEAVGWCGPHAAHGTYLMTCDNIMRTVPYPTKAVADTLLVRMDVSTEGDYTGTLYEKYGMTFIDNRPVSGKFSVNPDCSFSSTLVVQDIDGWIEQRGVFFNEGKEFYAMGILNPTKPEDPGIKHSFCHGTRIR